MPRSSATPECYYFAPRWVGWVWVLVWAVVLLAPAAVGGTAYPWLTGLGLLVLGVCFSAATLTAVRAPGRRSSRFWPLLVVQAAVTAALATVDGLQWGTLPLLLAIAVGASARLRWAPVLVAIVAAGATVIESARGAQWGEAILGTGVTVLLSGLLTFAFSWLASVIGELLRTREELARSAVATERLRFSRDLHDLLGHTLSVIVVKAEAARRSVYADPDAAARHAGDIETVGRDALAEVRQAVQGYRRTSLDTEIEQAVSALRSVGIETDVVRGENAVSKEQEDLLAWVVREGATNVLRHAHAQRASITTSTDDRGATVHIIDDGSGPPRGQDGVSEAGSGLSGLRERLREAGGRLEAGGDTSGFRLTAVVPTGASAPASPSAPSTTSAPASPSEERR